MKLKKPSKIRWIWRFLYITVFMGLFFYSQIPIQAANVVGYSEYYIMGVEADILDVLDDIPNGGVPDDATLESRVSIVASANGVNIYLDEEENGYGFDPSDPYGTADARWDAIGDGQGLALDRGDVLTLTEKDKFVPGSTGVGGGDRFYITGAPVSMVRTVWPTVPGPYLAGSWELYPVQRWQSSYTVPFGENTNLPPGGVPLNLPFEYTSLFIQAREDATTVVVNGTSYVLNQGDNVLIKNINAGTTIEATDGSGNPRHIQAGIVTSSDDVYDARYYTLTPEQYLCNEYYLPTPSMQFASGELGGRVVDNAVYIYAFQDNTNVTIETAAGLPTSLVINEGELRRFVLPQIPTGTITGDYGVRITTDNPADTIWTLVAGDDSGPDLDWGYQGLCVDQLSNDYFLPFSPANPAHITPVNDATEFFVDWDNDGVVDESFVLDRFETMMLYPPGPDYDASGAHIFADDIFTMAWGQDNTENTPGEVAYFGSGPDLDFGYIILPTSWPDPILGIEKTVTYIDGSPGPVTLPGEEGSIAEFTMVVRAESEDDDVYVYNLDVTDVLPPGWAYVNNSATITLGYTPFSSSTDNPDISVDGSTLTWDLAEMGLLDTMPAGSTITITYQSETKITGFTIGANINTAEAYGSSLPDDTDENSATFRPVDTAIVTLTEIPQHVEIGDYVWLDENSDGVQDASEPPLAGVILELDTGSCTVGTDCPTAVTDANGYYLFSNLPAGDYTVLVRASTLPAGVVQTFDYDGTLDNQYSLIATVAPGSYLYVDFGYRSPLSITKISSAGGTAVPGSTIDYTIVVHNNTGTTHENVVISDTLPVGTTYVSNSTLITHTTVVQFYDFEAGSMGWTTVSDAGNPATNWELGDPESVGVDGIDSDTCDLNCFGNGGPDDDHTISGTQAWGTDLDDLYGNNIIAGNYLYSPVFDFSGRTGVQVSYWEWLEIEGGDTDPDEIYDAAYFEYSVNGGPWMPVWDLSTDATREDDAWSEFTHDASGYADSQGAVQWRWYIVSDGGYQFAGWYIDDFTVRSTVTSGNGDAPPNLVTAAHDYDLLPNDILIVTFQVRVDDPVLADIISIDNTASVVSNQQLVPVEDSVTDLLVFADVDYGDLPASYNNTLLGINGPRHLIDTLNLGPLIDPELDGQESDTATGDTNDDGVTRDPTTNWVNGATVNLDIELRGSTASGTADVGIWIDWNNDGLFGVGDFFPFPGLAIGSVNTVQLTVPVRSTYLVGRTLNVRARAFDPAALPGNSLDSGDFIGFATNGEVEDYQWTFRPTAVSLSSFNANNKADSPVGLVVLFSLILTGSSFGFIRRRKKTN